MAHNIILCDDKNHAYTLTERMYDEECVKLKTPTPKEERTTKYLLGVEENVLSGQFGLSVPEKMTQRVDPRYLKNTVIKTPLWIDEKFINGEPFFALGVGPFGFGQINPKENRKILEGQFSEKVISEARQTARKYSVEIQNRAKNLILDYLTTSKNRDKLISELDSDLFEELVAEILVDKGFDIYITPKTRDGGKDIIAAYSFDGEPLVMMVECKRRKTNHTLGPIDVRALVGQFYFEKLKESRISYGMLVTSSGNIGKTAMNMSQEMNEISIKGYTDLQNWMANYGKSKSGLWLPESFGDFFQ